MEKVLGTETIFKNMLSPFGRDLVLYSAGFQRTDNANFLLYSGESSLKEIQAIGLDLTYATPTVTRGDLEKESFFTLSINEKDYFCDCARHLGSLDLPFVLPLSLSIGPSDALKMVLSLQKPFSEYLVIGGFVVQLALYGPLREG